MVEPYDAVGEVSVFEPSKNFWAANKFMCDDTQNGERGGYIKQVVGQLGHGVLIPLNPHMLNVIDFPNPLWNVRSAKQMQAYG